jgi:hypothetical protein
MQEPMADEAAFCKTDKSRHLAIVLITRSLDVNGEGRAMLLSQLPVLIAGGLIFAICSISSSARARMGRISRRSARSLTFSSLAMARVMTRMYHWRSGSVRDLKI